MTSSKGAHVTKSKTLDALVGVRLTRELLRAVDDNRGNVERGAWIRALIESAIDSDSWALADVAAYARKRGVSRESLMEYLDDST